MLSLLLFSLFCSVVFQETMHAGGKSEKDEDNTHYIELGRDQGFYRATIEDESITPVEGISFAGQTTIDGIRKESDSSLASLSMDQITALTILDPLYVSARYPTMELTAVRVTTTENINEDMLFPRHLSICGQDRTSNIKKTWPIRKIKSITFSHIQSRTTPKRSIRHGEGQ